MAEPAEDMGPAEDDGADILELGEDGQVAEEPPEPFFFDENADNLVFAFKEHPEGKAALLELSDKIRREWEQDWPAYEEYREQCKKDWDTFCCVLGKKDVPFRDCANLNVPMMIENVTRLHARMMVEMFGDWSAFARAVPFGPDDEKRADIVSMHTNYQLAWQTKGFRREMDRALLFTLVRGDVFGHSYYDEDDGRNVHETLSSDNFAIPFASITTKSDLSDAPHRFKILRKYRHQLQGKIGDWDNIEEVLKGRSMSDLHDDPRPEQMLADAERSKIEIPTDDESKPYVILQYEGHDDGILPNQVRDRFIQVFIEETTWQILKLSIWEEEDPRDRLRYESEVQQLQSYQATQRMAEAHAQQQLEVAQVQGMPSDQLVALDQRLRQGGALDVPPPRWMLETPEATEPRPPRSQPIHTFTHAVYIENLSGAMGVAPGRIQADHNRAANILLDQYVDQATLNNTPFGLAAQSLNLPKVFEIRPGVIKTVNADAMELKDGLREWRPGPANPQMVELIDKVKEWSQSSMQSPGVLSGEEGKSGETWRGIASRIEQATKQLSYGGQKFIHEFVGQILQNNARLNAIHLPDSELQYLFNHMIGQRQQVTISRKLYQRGYDWHLRADMRFATKAQRIGEADELVQMAMGIPALAMNAAYMYAVISAALEARGKHDLVAKLGQAPPAPEAFVLPLPQQPGQGEPPPQQ